MEKNIYKIGKELFITSDEEIKEGDWIFSTKTNNLFKADSIEYLESHNMIEDFDKSFYINSKYAKKIILTTDQSLDGVQSIDDEFLEWFVKNPNCYEVEVKTDYLLWKNSEKEKLSDCYKIIIPKEEPKQDWQPTQGEEVWIKVFSNWSKGTYIGYDVTKSTHIVREDERGGCHLFSSSEILPYYSMPNEPKQELERSITIIDPPSGWKYGFPKPIPEDRIEDVLVWLVEQGYPQSEIDDLGDYFSCRYWKQETAVEFLKKEYIKRGNCLPSGVFKDALEMEAKQDQNKYSEEEVHNIITSYKNNKPKVFLKVFYNEWFKQFKKEIK